MSAPWDRQRLAELALIISYAPIRHRHGQRRCRHCPAAGPARHRVVYLTFGWRSWPDMDDCCQRVFPSALRPNRRAIHGSMGLRSRRATFAPLHADDSVHAKNEGMRATRLVQIGEPAMGLNHAGSVRL